MCQCLGEQAKRKASSSYASVVMVDMIDVLACPAAPEIAILFLFVWYHAPSGPLLEKKNL